MKISGTSSYVKFDLEHGYVIKAEGERLINNDFVAYINSMKVWEPPHKEEKIEEKQILNIVKEVEKQNVDNKVKIYFE